MARIILPKFSEYLGQPVMIENRPGATGTVATGMVAKLPPVDTMPASAPGAWPIIRKSLRRRKPGCPGT